MKDRKQLTLGLVAGAVATMFVGILMGQGASQPVKSDTQYFVTGEGDDAHLWVREGTALRCVGHGECTTHAHDHADHADHKDAHDHGKEAPKK